MYQEHCKRCGSKLKLTLTPNSIHYAALRCELNNHFEGWAKNPESKTIDNLRTQNRANILSVSSYHCMKVPICFFCLRNQNQLGKVETLTVDHIRELSTTQEGEDLDVVQNMQILRTACHKLKNWARLYMNWHIVAKLDSEAPK